MVKRIEISDESHARLRKLGFIGDTFDGAIKRLLDEHEANERKESASKTVRRDFDLDEVRKSKRR